MTSVEMYIRTFVFGNTALHCAAAAKYVGASEMVEVLLNAGVDRGHKNKSGYASRHGGKNSRMDSPCMHVRD